VSGPSIVCQAFVISSAFSFSYFSDRLSDTDIFLAPVLFRVVAGTNHLLALYSHFIVCDLNLQSSLGAAMWRTRIVLR
jgi:hypothetical protein